MQKSRFFGDLCTTDKIEGEDDDDIDSTGNSSDDANERSPVNVEVDGILDIDALQSPPSTRKKHSSSTFAQDFVPSMSQVSY